MAEPKRMKEMKIVLVGKTGVGKSTCANTILGRKEFKSVLSPASVTAQSKKARAEVNGRDVYVVDTPGLYDTEKKNSDELIKEIGKCICMSSPGPHVILVVIQLGRFTEEEQKSVQKIQEIFGQHAAKYTMVLFSHGEGLGNTTIEEFIVQSKPLKTFTAQCRGGCHVFRNKEPENRSQVTELLQKIDQMVALNGGGYYTNEMYQRAEAAIEKEKQRILKETEEKRKKEEEELKQLEKNKVELEKKMQELKKAEAEKARLKAEEKKLKQAIKDKEGLEKKIEELEKAAEKAREQAELDNNFIKTFTIKGAITGAVVGAAGGAVAGFAIAGPAGAAVGTVVGAAAGAGGGAASGAATGAAKKDKCIIL